ncbi:MAG: hypothetical protein FJW90_01750 [Actinobacteria bacterium]|nr:hypothetical protein [Actinomycetota bacterium]
MAMAEGERFRSEGARGIARFLSEHQHPEAGFDVSREAGPGSGRLLITCLGCGASIACRAVDAGEMAACPRSALRTVTRVRALGPGQASRIQTAVPLRAAAGPMACARRTPWQRC